MKAREARRVIDARERCPVCVTFARGDKAAVILAKRRAIGLCFKHRQELGRLLAFVRPRETEKAEAVVLGDDSEEGP